MIGGGFRRLTRTLRRVERAGWEISNVYPTADHGLCDGEKIAVEVHCRCPTDYRHGRSTNVTLDSIADASKSANIRLCRQELLPTGATAAVLRIQVPLEHGEKSSPTQEVNEDETPLHRNEDRLRELYHRYETFAEMTEAVSIDLSAETIRRYMIEHGIHEPGSDRRSETSAPSIEASLPPTEPGYLPSGIDLEEVIESVQRSRTLYDVQQALDLDRQTTVTLLRRLDLLDLVVGRLEQLNDREIHPEMIAQRVARAAGSDSGELSSSPP